MAEVIWTVAFWLAVATLGSFAYATIGMTLRRLERPRLRGNPLALRWGLALSLLGIAGGWLAWAALTTDFAKGSPMSFGADLAGVVVFPLLVCLFAAENETVRTLARVLWPIGIVSVLVGRMLLHSATGVHRAVSGASERLVDLINKEEPRTKDRSARIRALEDELGISDGRLLDLPEIQQRGGR